MGTPKIAYSGIGLGNLSVELGGVGLKQLYFHNFSHHFVPSPLFGAAPASFMRSRIFSMSQPVSIGEGLRFLVRRGRGALLVAAARALAVGFAFPRMPQHVAALEVFAIARLLEDEVFREMLAVVANVQPREENVAARRRGPGPAPARLCRPRPARTRRASQLLRSTADRRRTGRTSSCPTRIR